MPAPKSWFTIRNVTTDSLTIDILDEIGYWGVTAKDFATALKAAGSVKNITLRLDCPGGDCNDGFTIFDALKATGAHVTVEIIGLAASMASVIMLAGHKIRIAENGRVMIHRVTAAAHGNFDELDAAAKIAKQFEDRIVELYIARTQQDEAAIRAWMQTSQGTWFFGQAAIDSGFADELITGQKALAFNHRWAAKFTLLPAALFDTTAPSTAPPAPKHMKAILALAALVGITVKGDETEDQIEALIKAHKPVPPSVELNLDDPETKKRFEAAIATALPAALKPMEDKMKLLEEDNKKITALIANGGAAAGGGNPPVVTGQGKEKKELTRDAFNALSSTEQNEFFNKGGKLI